MQGSNWTESGTNLSVNNSVFHGNVGDVNSHNFNVRVNVRDVNIHLKAAESRKELAEWISPLDFSSNHAQALDKRTPGTLEWLIASPAFLNWRSRRGCFLWCPGPPGAGKTVFASFVIDLLQKAYYEDPSSVSAVCYIYCQYSNKLSVLQLFEALLKQLILLCPSIEIDKLERMKDQNRRLPLDEITNILQSNFLRFPGMFIVIDALDECFSESDRHHLLQKLHAFSDVNILTTSRDLPRIAEAMQDVAQLNIYAIEGDVKIHAHAQRQQNPQFANLTAKVSSIDVDAKVISKASGSFLLADWHITYLSEQTTERAFINALDTLPTDAAASHASTIGRINRQSKPDICLAYAVLSLVLYAFRPFKSIELRHAAANLTLDRLAQKDDLADEGKIISVCAGLITVNQCSMEVGFIHHTVHEYLQQIQQISDLFLPEAKIAKSLMQLIRSPGVVMRPPNHPLVQYAASSWAHHLQRCEGDDLVTEMALSLLSDSGHAEVLCSNWNPYWLINGPCGVQPMHLVAAFGLTQIGKLFLQQNPKCIDQQDYRGRTPLSWAAAEGHPNTVLMLLEARNIKALSIRTISPKLVLRKCLDAINQPAMWKAHVNTKDKWDRTPLSYAAEKGHFKVVKMLLKTGKVSINERDRSGRTPFSLAAREGHLEVMKILLDTGKAEIDAGDGYGRTPLSYAARNGHLEVVKMLLNTGEVEVDVKDGKGRTPLCYAAMNGYLEVVKMLLDSGRVEINMKDEKGRTPLSYAAGMGRLESVKILLNTGKADVDTTDSLGLNPLNYAQWNHHRNIVDFLKDYPRFPRQPPNISHPSVTKIVLGAGDVEIDVKADEVEQHFPMQHRGIAI